MLADAAVPGAVVVVVVVVVVLVELDMPISARWDASPVAEEVRTIDDGRCRSRRFAAAIPLLLNTSVSPPPPGSMVAVVEINDNCRLMGGDPVADPIVPRVGFPSVVTAVVALTPQALPRGAMAAAGNMTKPPLLLPSAAAWVLKEDSVDGVVTP